MLFLMLLDDETRSLLEQIYDIHKRTIFLTAYDILKDPHEAQDVVQETIIRVSKQLDKIDAAESSRTRAYLCIIAKNLALNAYNKKKKISLRDDHDITELIDLNSLLESSQILDGEDIYDLKSELSKINPNYAEIITLRYYYELEIDEISDLLNISPNNVSTRIYRGIKALKKNIQSEEAMLNEKYI